MERERDSQRKKVYKWETKTGLWDKNDYLTESKACAFFEEVLTKYGYANINPNPRLHFSKKMRSGGASYSNNKVVISTKNIKKHVILHEIAHIITNTLYGINTAGHGEEFVMVLLSLYIDYGVIKNKSNLQDLIFEGVKVKDFESIYLPEREKK